MELKAIGYVKNEFEQPLRQDWGKVISDIVMDHGLTEALDGITDFSHIIVVYWLHKAAGNGEPRYRVHPRGNKEVPEVGLFATRSPHRPNAIGIATVELIAHRDNVLKVRGLDAVSGTPVLDIKPYIAAYDSPANTRVASWTTGQ